jgi:hypothetical protein
MAPSKPPPLNRLMVSLKLKQPDAGLSREQAMAAWPVRNPALTSRTNEEGIVGVDLPRRKDMVGRMLGYLFSVPDSKPIVLDEVGSFVWARCDGEHTVNELVTALCEEYKLNRREAEVSLTQFLQMLGKRGMVAFAVPREVAEAAGLSGRAMAPDDETGESAAADQTPNGEAP